MTVEPIPVERGPETRSPAPRQRHGSLGCGQIRLDDTSLRRSSAVSEAQRTRAPIQRSPRCGGVLFAGSSQWPSGFIVWPPCPSHGSRACSLRRCTILASSALDCPALGSCSHVLGASAGVHDQERRSASKARRSTRSSGQDRNPDGGNGAGAGRPPPVSRTVTCCDLRRPRAASEHPSCHVGLTGASRGLDIRARRSSTRSPAAACPDWSRAAIVALGNAA